MKTCLLLLIVALHAGNSQAIDRCSVVSAIKNGGIIGIKGYTLGDYVCLAYRASRYDTSLNRSPTEYGIFQISSYWWCDDGRTVGRKNLCGLSCKNLLNSDIEDDVRCLKRIVKDPNGLKAWSAWTMYCKGTDLSSYTTGCD